MPRANVKKTEIAEKAKVHRKILKNGPWMRGSEVDPVICPVKCAEPRRSYGRAFAVSVVEFVLLNAEASTVNSWRSFAAA